MRILDTPRPLLAPGVCAVCRMSPDGEWVDTLYDNDLGQGHELSGRIYVCGSCAETMAGVLGFQRVDERLEEAELRIVELEGQYEGLLERVHALLEEDA